jgi:CheY-like chemotaxis protein
VTPADAVVASAHDKLILVIEDNTDNVALIRRALQKAGVAAEVAVAGNDVEARDFLYAQGAWQARDVERSPDLILLDINLPGLSGLDFLRLLRINARTRHTPVVVFTSSDQPRDVAVAYERGATSYVRKPVDFARFSEVVRIVALYWLTVHIPAAQAET